MLTCYVCRCSLLEEDELPEDPGNLKQQANGCLLEVQDLPLPDIVTSEEEARELNPPPILIEEAEDCEGREDECPVCEPIVASPQPLVASPHPLPTLAKDYTVEEGFERPEGGWEEATESSLQGNASVEANCDSDDEDTQPRERDPKSSSSSSLPSESSGIFYKAEYTPHPSHHASSAPSPAPGLLSVANRDSYWSAFFHKETGPPRLRKSSSGNMDCVRNSLLPRPSGVTKSKSDARIHYSETETTQKQAEANEPEYTDQDLSFPNTAAFRAEVVLPRSSMKSPKAEEVDVRPLTECSSGHSPENGASGDNLSSTISQEMQDLLSSIQSLGKTDSGDSSSKVFSPQSVISRNNPSNESNLDFDQLMAEVESQIRFSATAELLERMAACPAIEQSPVVPSIPSEYAPPRPPSPVQSILPSSTQGSPPVPDLLRPALDRPPGQCPEQRPEARPSLTTTPCSTPSLDAPGNRRYTSLRRPSDMAGERSYTPTGRVPDMLSRVNLEANSRSPSYSSFESVRDDLSKVRSDIDHLRQSLNETKTSVAANSRDILARCSFFTDTTQGKMVEGRLLNGSSLESDLAETSSAMQEIERTVNSFTKQNSLPTGRVTQPEQVSSPNPRRIFAGANQGSVTKTKDRFEQRTVESRIPMSLTGPKPRCTTPFSKTRSPSPAFDSRDKKRQLSITGSDSTEPNTGFRGRKGTGTGMNLRKRSPSPVVTGKVSTFRSKFENSPGSSPSNNNTPPPRPRPRTSPFRERISPPQTINPTSYSLGRDTSSGRLPNHFVPKSSQAPTSRPNLGRAQSLRNPRFSLPHSPAPTSEATTAQMAANFLRSTLPRKSLPETPSFESNTIERDRFRYNRI